MYIYIVGWYLDNYKVDFYREDWEVMVILFVVSWSDL